MITDLQIATLCDVARSAGTNLSADKRSVLPELVATGHVVVLEAAGDRHPRYKLTPAGQSVLDDRGVGANES